MYVVDFSYLYKIKREFFQEIFELFSGKVWRFEIMFVFLRRSSFNSMTVYPSITSLYGLFSCPAVLTFQYGVPLRDAVVMAVSVML